MAYVNVAEWKTDQVCEWLKGLDNTVLPYVHSFTNNCVNGQQLLNLRPEDLDQLGVLKLGHQEIILEAVEYLRNFHYELDRENLQLLALHLSCRSHSLHNELSRHTDSKPVATQTLSDVASVVTAVKPLVRWLDRPPFSGQLEYNDKKMELLKLSLEMATCAQRDRFAEKPIEEIRTTCGQLAKLADYIIQDISDPMILQPASLDLATLKKRPGDDLGFYILPSFHGNHQIAEIKFGSAAHTCGKMEEGDEIVQVNYQTVVGWERKNVLELFTESPAEVLLTLKRRPRHTKVYGQIYIKPYRLPSNKKTPYATRWQHNLPSPRPELLTIPDFTMPLPRHVPKEPSPEPASITDTVSILDTLASDSSDSDSEVEPASSVRLYATKPRNLVQRRATITGASPTTKHAIDIEQLWRELKHEHSASFHLRDKAASCAHGLDSVQSASNNRPQTCLGIEQTKRKKRHDEQKASGDEKKVQFNERSLENSLQQDEFEKIMNERQGNGIASTSVSRRDRETASNNISNDVPFDKCEDKNLTYSERDTTSVSEISRIRKERGKLDKSHSTPAYDLTETTRTCDVTEIRDNRGKTNNVVSKSATSVSSINANETENSDKALSDEILDINIEDARINDTSDVKEDREIEIRSVAQRVNYIESHMQNNEHDDRTRMRNNGDSTVSGASRLVDDETMINSPRNEITRESPRVDERCEIERSSPIARIMQEYGEFGRDSSEEKSESTSSYVEGIYSSSSEADLPTRRNPDNENASSITAMNRRLQEIRENSCVSRSPRSDHSISQQNHVPSPRQCVESTKMEFSKKIENRGRLTPPEPPPRKYFSKPLPLNLNHESSDLREAQKPMELPDSRTDHRKIEHPPEVPSMAENPSSTRGRDGFEAYRDFVERSMDFIDEPVATSTLTFNENKTSSIIDQYGYTEIYEGPSSRDDKSANERYEPFHEKFGNGMIMGHDNHPPEIVPRTIDSPDGSGCSRQQAPSTPDPKAKTLEKERHCDKGVVNRAMMVARSIGLHGGSNKSSNSSSPRSSRKRNLLLAKRRNVSVKDVGTGDLEGWLTHRSRGAGGAWARSWFVLKSSSLYRFKAQDSGKSDCLIALPGFTASTAAEVKSRKYAFKVYHTGTVFYFAAETEDCLVLWLDAINKATLGADSQNRTSGLFSETDESDSESTSGTITTPTSTMTTTTTKNNRGKGTTGNETTKPCHETMFGSLKKIGRKDNSYKDHEIGGASLDRKYLRFLGSRNQNVPVPTAQFRSYRRVLPTSTSNRKQDSTPNSPDLRVTVAGSTFYGLSASQSATDVPSTSQDMGDYRQTTERSQSTRGRRSDDLRGFVTLEEFMLAAHQNENRRQGASSSNGTASPRVTPLTSDHVHIQHRNFDDGSGTHGRSFGDPALSNGMIYGHPRNGEETIATNNPRISHVEKNENDIGTLRINDDRCSDRNVVPSRSSSYNDKNSIGSNISYNRKNHEGAVYYPNKRSTDLSSWQNITNEMTSEQQNRTNAKNSTGNRLDLGITRLRNFGRDNASMRIQNRNDQYNDNGNCMIRDNFHTRESSFGDSMTGFQSTPRRYVRDNGYVGSSGDLTCCSTSPSETLQRARKEASVSRKGSFNLTDRRRDRSPPDRHWMDSLRRNDRRINATDKTRLKNVAQYQPPPIPSISPFEQEGMRAAFEMHLDKGEQVLQKTNRLKSLFGSKSPQKPNSLDLPKESPKTLLGSPRLHRALFRDKSSSSQQQRQQTRSGSQSPGDSGISQSFSSYSGNSHSHTPSQSFSSVSSVSDWSPDTPTPNASKCTMGHPACQKRYSNLNRSLLSPPTLPYIPPPTSPPPDDYPGLEYPPVFEPGTYSLTDPSLIRNRNKTGANKGNRENEDP